MPSSRLPRRAFLVASGVVAAVGVQSETVAQQSEPSDTESVEDAVTFVDCDTVEIEGAFETVSMSAHTYDSDGFDTFSADFGPTEGTTTLPPDDFGYFPDGLNGYLIPSVRLVDSEGGVTTVDNPNEDDCYDRIRPDQPSVAFVAAEPDDDSIETTFRVENPNDGVLDTQTTVEPELADPELPFEYEPGPTQFTLQWQPETESEQLVVTVDVERFGYEESPTAETPPASEIRDTEPEAFDPEISISCHTVRVDADEYDSVELAFDDGTTVTFDEGYNGQTEFGFSGDGRISTDDTGAVDEFHGTIEQVTVTSGEATETVDRGDNRCIFEDLVFECDSARHGLADDTRMAFVDGSFKMWDPPADLDQERFGSPGRVIESITEEGGDITVENPNQDCNPGEYATVFDCTEVTITDAEFEVEPTFDLVRLNFVDDSTQEFGKLSDGPHFTAPETFAGSGDHEGKVIESVEIEKLGGDIFFQLVNPDVDDCEPVEAFEPSITVDSYSVTVDADSYDRVVCELADGTTETFEGDFSGEHQFGYEGAKPLWDAPDERTFGTFHGSIERCIVERGDRRQEQAGGDDRAVITDVRFDCSTVEFSGTSSDIRLYYDDGSFDWCEREQSGTVRYGSPGRLLGGVYFADLGLWLSNPATDCEPEPGRMRFACRAVRITADEFGPEPGEVNRLQLVFEDGTDQVFGSPNPDVAAFETPAVFSGVDDHAGKVIERAICELPGREVFFVRTNPGVDDCEPAPPEDDTDADEGSNGAGSDDGSNGGGSDSGSTGGDTVTAGGGDATAIAESDSEAVSRSETVVEVDTDDTIVTMPEEHPGPAEDSETAVEPPETEGEGLVEQVPWWGWVAAIGGAGGAVSYAVGRTLDDEHEAETDSGVSRERASTDEAGGESTDDGGELTDVSSGESTDEAGGEATDTYSGDDGASTGSVDEEPNRWGEYGDG